MVKSYLKFEHVKTFGVVVSPTSNILVNGKAGASQDPQKSTSLGRAYVPANEEVLVWDVRKGEIIAKWRDNKCSAAVTALAHHETNPDVYAVGYGDGSIRIWDSKFHSVLVTLNGHRSGVTHLAFDQEGVRLASGSRDTDIIVWDLVAETGQYKLRGHKDQITGLCFIDRVNDPSANGRPIDCLLSTSKDSLVKLWSLETQYCLETHVAQSNGECWSLGVAPDLSHFLTSGSNGELAVWTLNLTQIQGSEKSNGGFLVKMGTMYRNGKDRTSGIYFDGNQRHIAVHGSEKAVEIIKIKSEAEVRKTLARKRKRQREKENAQVNRSSSKVEPVNGDEDLSTASISDMFSPPVVIRTGGKVSSVSWIRGSRLKTLEILVGTSNNQLEVYKASLDQKSPGSDGSQGPDYSRIASVDIPGHRTDIRTLSLSSDDKMLASASSGNLKIWNVKTQNCLRTFESGYALCSAFLPGDRMLLVGTKSGHLELYDVASTSIIETKQAHDDAIWALCVHPDGKSVITGGADKSAKFWDFKIIHEDIPGTKRTIAKLTLVQKRELKLTDDILSLKISPDSRLVAVALLDYTIKVYFLDTLKLFLNLYGHKLPVLSMDISYDSKLLVSCAADKDMRIWGLDFGDCHKAIFAHQDSILQVAFMPNNHEGNGHHCFSASKDKEIKYWDCDKFQQIQRLKGHHGEIWALAISHSGDFLVSASHDKSMRIWQQTDEQLFLEEERERELEELYEATLTTSLENDVEGEVPREVAAASKQTIETLMAGERIIEALEYGIEDFRLMKDWSMKGSAPQRNPLFMALGGISAERHVLNVIQKIQPAALHDALLVLPFTNLPLLFTFIEIWLAKGWHVSLTCRILFFMIKTHHKQIVSSKALRVMLDKIRMELRTALHSQKNEIGFNMAGLNFVGRLAKERGVKDFVDEESWDQSQLGVGKRKRGFVDLA